MDRAREQGVNFADTADVYNDGVSEEITGRAIAAHRNWWVIATKLANPTGPWAECTRACPGAMPSPPSMQA